MLSVGRIFEMETGSTIMNRTTGNRTGFEIAKYGTPGTHPAQGGKTNPENASTIKGTQDNRFTKGNDDNKALGAPTNPDSAAKSAKTTTNKDGYQTNKVIKYV